MNWEHLDNPVWYALWDVQDQQAALFPHLQAYLPQYADFAASLYPNKIANSLEIYSQLSPHFYFVGEKPALPESLSVRNELVCDQMVWTGRQPFDSVDPAVVFLDDSYRKEIVELVSLVQPGYIKAHTPDLGNYYGIFDQGKLVSVGGQRMQTNDFIEVSGCVTHPDYQQRGLQRKIIQAVVNDILLKGKTPFLHVLSTNTGAIHLYRQLDFKFRRNITFWEIQ